MMEMNRNQARTTMDNEVELKEQGLLNTIQIKAGSNLRTGKIDVANTEGEAL